jgi:serine/threonine protein kinase
MAGRALPPSDVVNIASQVATGLADAHSKNIVHRDIKPSNIMITKNGVVKIVDFGIARMTQQTATWTNVIRGTAGYMSPEQTLGHNVDQRTDLWSLGVVMAEALTGHHPFQRDSMPASRLRFTEVAAHAAEIDPASQRVQDFIRFLQLHKTVLDPTLTIFEGMCTDRPGTVSTSYRAVADRMPAQIRRQFFYGGLEVPDGMDQRYRDSFQRHCLPSRNRCRGSVAVGRAGSGKNRFAVSTRDRAPDDLAALRHCHRPLPGVPPTSPGA